MKCSLPSALTITNIRGRYALARYHASPEEDFCLCWQVANLSYELSGDKDCRATITRHQPFGRRCDWQLHWQLPLLTFRSSNPNGFGKVPDKCGQSTSRVLFWHIGRSRFNWASPMAFPCCKRWTLQIEQKVSNDGSKHTSHTRLSNQIALM